MSQSSLSAPSKHFDKTTRMSSASNLSATFNDFLFATVCEERNEMPLSVISALARLDLDPWAEAAELARMPEEGATMRLTSLLAGVIDVPSADADRVTVSARLVALLPSSTSTVVLSRGRSDLTPTIPQIRAIRILWLACLASMAVSVLLANLAPGTGARGPTPGPTTAAAPRR